MRILLTNDDGIEAPGLQEAGRALSPLHEIYVVAPDREQSAVSHKITLRKPVTVTPRDLPFPAAGGWAVEGTPADCVKAAFFHLLPHRPHLVVSGINRGINVGIDVLYSGTVAGAREGVLRNVQGLALSLQTQGPDLGIAVRTLVGLVGVLREHPLPEGVMLNVNVPRTVDLDRPRLRLTRQSGRMFDESCAVESGEDGAAVLVFSGKKRDCAFDRGSDCQAMLDGVISVTPLGLNLNEPGAAEHAAEVVSRHPFSD